VKAITFAADAVPLTGERLLGLALCGHPGCSPHQRRNSILDDEGDVVIYNACDGVKYVFRDDVCHGLILGSGWTLTREGETEVAATITNIGDRSWVATWPGGRVFARWDTGAGLLAKVARRLLNPKECCR
jgi:hypothetical protein